MIDILISAFALSVVLVGIHSYYGLEIIKRGIIFTDLAIGQMAAMGAAVSILFLEGQYIYPLSLLFALSGGFVIAVSSRKNENLEAFIGLMYAFGISGVFILLSKSSHGMETFQKLMAADILFTPMNDIIKTAILYGLLGIVIYIFHNKTKGFLRDALFFITFSVTVTSSVKLAGVLTVFALLVAPALISLIINRGKLLINAWIIGIAVNLTAILVSYNFDFPTGYTLVLLHAFIALIVSFIFGKKKRLVE
ncbi:MAG TPA: metal ABC transporter permease [Spirochaetota bacterium]|nr:metal ABC transporter permease [Spirochaetota bacterium]HPJ37911.1 metal ABC transporter permease [Spirochaetota bacterium]HPQ52405.1 metal ABC transporter permease [Spirochaetota bacterium]